MWFQMTCVYVQIRKCRLFTARRIMLLTDVGLKTVS